MEWGTRNSELEIDAEYTCQYFVLFQLTAGEKLRFPCSNLILTRPFPLIPFQSQTSYAANLLARQTHLHTTYILKRPTGASIRDSTVSRVSTINNLISSCYVV